MKTAPLDWHRQLLSIRDVLKIIAPQLYSKPTWGIISEGIGPLGNQKQYGWIKTEINTTTPGGGGSGAGGPSNELLAPGVKFDPSITGDAQLEQYHPMLQGIVRAMQRGEVMPTGNSRMQGMIPFAKQLALKIASEGGTPYSDTTYAAARTLATQLESLCP